MRLGSPLLPPPSSAPCCCSGVWLTHSLVHGWVGRTDDSIERQLLSGRTSFWNTLTNAGTQLAQPITVEVALVVLVIALAVMTRGWIAPTFLALTVGIESGIYFVTSTLDHRPRPSIPRLGIGDPQASYPSGHVAASICLYGGLAVLAWVLTDRRWLQWTLTVVAVVVPAGRRTVPHVPRLPPPQRRHRRCAPRPALADRDDPALPAAGPGAATWRRLRPSHVAPSGRTHGLTAGRGSATLYLWR